MEFEIITHEYCRLLVSSFPKHRSLLFLLSFIAAFLLELDGEAELCELLDGNEARLIRVGFNFLDELINEHLVHSVAELGKSPAHLRHWNLARLIGVKDLERLEQLLDGVGRLVHLIQHRVNLRCLVETLRARFFDWGNQPLNIGVRWIEIEPLQHTSQLFLGDHLILVAVKIFEVFVNIFVGFLRNERVLLASNLGGLSGRIAGIRGWLSSH